MSAWQVRPEHAKAIANAAGVVGIWHLFPSAEKYVQGVREIMDVIGTDHVGIGMDWAIESINRTWPDQTDGMMYTVIGEMLKEGFTPEECGKIAGGNSLPRIQGLSLSESLLLEGRLCKQLRIEVIVPA
jgi:membrane dipeptidase